MNNLITETEEYIKEADKEAKAHKVSAEYHRSMHMRLGTIATISTAIVGVGVLTDFVNNENIPWLNFVIVSLSIIAAVVTAIHRFWHNAEDSASHRISEYDYIQIKRRLKSFHDQYVDIISDVENKEKARKEFDEIIKEFGAIGKTSIPMPQKAYRNTN